MLVDCSNGVGWRTLSSGTRHRNTGGIFSGLHAAAAAGLQTSGWVLVSSCSHFAKPDISIYSNVCTNLFRETVFVSILHVAHVACFYCCMMCCYKEIILSLAFPLVSSGTWESLPKYWNEQLKKTASQACCRMTKTEPYCHDGFTGYCLIVLNAHKMLVHLDRSTDDLVTLSDTVRLKNREVLL